MTRIFHITHVDNVASVAASGLLCDNDVPTLEGGHRNIAYTGIKAQRAVTPVPCGPGGTLSGYVPFYFAPRSPMLYTIWRDNVADAVGQHDNIVHLVLRAEEIVDAGLPFAFTDGHATMELSGFYDDLAKLTEIDWEVMRAQYWSTDGIGEMRRKRQAEFLVLRHVPWSFVVGIGVHNAKVDAKLKKVLAQVQHRPPVAVKPEWYY